MVPQTFLGRNGATRGAVGAALQVKEAELRTASRTRATAVVLTALDLEHESVARHLNKTEVVRRDGGTRFTIGGFRGSGIAWRVAVAEIGAGNVGAAIEATRAIKQWTPDLLFFVGVAGARKKDVPLGTLVVPNRVYFYEGGRADSDAFRARPLSFPTPYALEQLVRATRRKWRGPAVLLKPIAAGEAVVGSARSDLAQYLDEHFDDAAAVDMESAGMYEAAHRHVVPALSVRAISDRFDDKDPVHDAKFQATAIAGAARFALEVLFNAAPADLRRAR
ncbi:MAG: 5'-methylthioadenosine/S-adenosylhomocysteine nucleosidase [Acidimicrobiia bacterium]